MSDSLRNFYQKISHEVLLTQNLFNLRFNLQSVPAGVNNALRDIQLYAESTSVPGVTQNVQEISYRGAMLRIPTNVEFDGEYSITIRSDAAHRIRGALIAWQNSISGLNWRENPFAPGGNKRIGNNIVELDLLDPGNHYPLTTYQIHGVIPNNIGEIEMTQEGAEVATFEFSMHYQFWIVSQSAEHLSSGVIPSDSLSKARDVLNTARDVINILEMMNRL